jgi:hypothetical protein
MPIQNSVGSLSYPKADSGNVAIREYYAIKMDSPAQTSGPVSYPGTTLLNPSDDTYSYFVAQINDLPSVTTILGNTSPVFNNESTLLEYSPPSTYEVSLFSYTDSKWNPEHYITTGGIDIIGQSVEKKEYLPGDYRDGTVLGTMITTKPDNSTFFYTQLPKLGRTSATGQFTNKHQLNWLSLDVDQSDGTRYVGGFDTIQSGNVYGVAPQLQSINDNNTVTTITRWTEVGTDIDRVSGAPDTFENFCVALSDFTDSVYVAYSKNNSNTTSRVYIRELDKTVSSNVNPTLNSIGIEYKPGGVAQFVGIVDLAVNPTNGNIGLLLHGLQSGTNFYFFIEIDSTLSTVLTKYYTTSHTMHSLVYDSNGYFYMSGIHNTSNFWQVWKTFGVARVVSVNLSTPSFSPQSKLYANGTDIFFNASGIKTFGGSPYSFTVKSDGLPAIQQENFRDGNGKVNITAGSTSWVTAGSEIVTFTPVATDTAETANSYGINPPATSNVAITSSTAFIN